MRNSRRCLRQPVCGEPGLRRSARPIGAVLCFRQPSVFPSDRACDFGFQGRQCVAGHGPRTHDRADKVALSRLNWNFPDDEGALHALDLSRDDMNTVVEAAAEDERSKGRFWPWF
jgi:hypothetical protein